MLALVFVLIEGVMQFGQSILILQPKLDEGIDTILHKDNTTLINANLPLNYNSTLIFASQLSDYFSALNKSESILNLEVSKSNVLYKSAL